jgi:hypothetical protein
VYALGNITTRFPSLGVDREFAQATSRSETAGLTDRHALQAVLAKPENRYLVRRLCWVLSVGGVETYILQPRDPSDFQLLVDALRPAPHPSDLDVVIGTLGPVAPPEMCNGLMVPVVAFDQVYSFQRDGLIRTVPRPEAIPEAQDAKFRASAGEVFDRIIQLADNAGATDEHRALNYLAVRYSGIYATAAECHARNCALTAIDTRPSRLAGPRNLLDVIFTYTNRATGVEEKYGARVDVTEQFPFLVSKLVPYFDR